MTGIKVLNSYCYETRPVYCELLSPLDFCSWTVARSKERLLLPIIIYQDWLRYKSCMSPSVLLLVSATIPLSQNQEGSQAFCSLRSGLVDLGQMSRWEWGRQQKSVEKKWLLQCIRRDVADLWFVCQLRCLVHTVFMLLWIKFLMTWTCRLFSTLARLQWCIGGNEGSSGSVTSPPFLLL